MRRAKLPRKWLIAGFTFVVTAVAVMLIANLSLGDKHIEERVETLYSVADPQFRRNVNVMLGPPPQALKAHLAGGMGEPPLDREALGAHDGVVQFAALRKKGYS
jgi:hypothetical protein